MRYSSTGPLVLDGLNIKISGGSNVGIVGRTGSGKSSILLTLFRVSEYSGKVLLDGVDISSLPVSYLRSKIGIIPQDTVVYRGTLRDNLSFSTGTPGRRATDEECADAMRAAAPGLMEKLEEKGGLDADLMGGAGLSVGEKSLISLARCVLKKNISNIKLLAIDEVSSALDPVTSGIVERVVLERFVRDGCTVMEVRHREYRDGLYDRVLEMRNGKAKDVG